ncbi:divalent-cation tolerance protein CutA [Candidatus Micrarchaeota archaeon]|nr:divalent-cation tolerance protein CutA [Candidatus Micrarchaeota archaeon]
MADANEVVLGYVICADAGEGQRIADVLVREKLAACVNILTGVHSVFSWQGEVQHADEVLLLCKTTRAKIPAFEKKVKSLHSHDVPCVCFYPAMHVGAEYERWLRDFLAVT